jgi:hypothetical protein
MIPGLLERLTVQALDLSDTIIVNHFQANSGFDTPSTGSRKGQKPATSK